MGVKESKMFEYMDNCNGEIRVMAGRYGGGWLSAGCAVIEWDFDEQWNDLVRSDNEYIRAVEYFNTSSDIVLIECARTPREAFDACAKKLSENIDSI